MVMRPSNIDVQPAGLPVPNSSGSFWHSEPNAFLMNHRTTESLPESADVVIVGSGITGASAARFLTEDPRCKNKSVVLLEAREVCWGATGRNGGHCQPLLFDRSPDIAAFEVKNVNTVESYITKHNVPCEWQKVTACRTFWDKALFKAAEIEVAKLKKADPETGKLVQIITSPEDLAKHRVQKHCAGATLTEGAGCLWPYKYVAFMLEKAVKEGRLNLQTNTRVTSISSESSSSKSYRHTLETPRGSIKAKHIILATNGYTSHLLPSFIPLIVPMRCEMSALHPPRGSDRLPDSYGFVGAAGQSADKDDYLIQRPFYDTPSGRTGGHLMFGGGSGFATYDRVGEWRDDIVDPQEATYLRRSLLRHLELGGEVEKDRHGKAMDELRASHQWTGIKGYSRDDTPWVGAVPGEGQKGIWLCGGYTGHGMPNATLCAKAVVEMVLDENVGVGYEASCKKLVDANDLPQSYVITFERLKKAVEMPTVREQDEQGVASGKHSAEFVQEAEQAREAARCQMM